MRSFLTAQSEIPPPPEEVFQTLHVALSDQSKQYLLDRISSISSFIDEGRRAGGVYVHCAAGVSRSATVVIAYLMFREKMCLRMAFDYVKKCRPVVEPNDGFMKQLIELEDLLFGIETLPFLEVMQTRLRELFPRAPDEVIFYAAHRSSLDSASQAVWQFLNGEEKSNA
jgi:protein tyrosine/serine phosphatase